MRRSMRYPCLDNHLEIRRIKLVCSSHGAFASRQESAFPLYDAVKAEHVVPGITQLLADLNAEIDRLEQSVLPTFEGLVEPLERISDRLGRAWGTVSHLKAGSYCHFGRYCYNDTKV